MHFLRVNISRICGVSACLLLTCLSPSTLYGQTTASPGSHNRSVISSDTNTNTDPLITTTNAPSSSPDSIILGSAAASLPLLGPAAMGAGLAKHWRWVVNAAKSHQAFLPFVAAAGSFITWRVLSHHQPADITSISFPSLLPELPDKSGVHSELSAPNSVSSEEKRSDFLNQEPDPNNPVWLVFLKQLDKKDKEDSLFPLAQEHRTLEDLITILDYLPTQELQRRASKLMLDGKPALNAQELQMVHGYVVDLMFDELRGHEKKQFLGEVLGFYPSQTIQESSRENHAQLISKFQSVVQRFTKSHQDRLKLRNALLTEERVKEKEKERSAKPAASTQANVPPTQTLTLANLKEQISKLSETEVMVGLRNSDLFINVDLKDTFTYPSFNHDSLMKYLQRAPKAKKHIIYSAILNLELTPDQDLAKLYSLKRLSIPAYRTQAKASLLWLFRQKPVDTNPVFSLKELEAKFAELSEIEVMERIRNMELFADIDLTNFSEFPDFSYVILTGYLKITHKVRKYIFLTLVLPDVTMNHSQIAEHHSMPTSGVWYHQGALKEDLLQLFRKALPTEPLSFVKLERKFAELSETEVMERLMTSTLFRNINLSDTSEFPDLSYKTLVDYLEGSSKVTRHLFYSFTMGLDGLHVRDQTIGNEYSLKLNTVQTYRARTRDNLVRLFRQSTIKSTPSLAELESQFAELSDDEVIRSLESHPWFKHLRVDNNSTRLNGEMLDGYLSQEKREVRLHLFYSLILDMDIPNRELSEIYATSKSGISYHRKTLRTDLSKLFHNNTPTTALSLAKLERKFAELSETEVMERLSHSSLFGDTDLTDTSIFPDFTYPIITKYLTQAPKIKKRIFYGLALGLDETISTQELERQLAVISPNTKYHRDRLVDDLSRLFSRGRVLMATFSLDKLERQFAELSETEVMTRLSGSPIFNHIDLTDKSAFPDFSYEILTDYLSRISKVKKHLLYSSILALDIDVRYSELGTLYSITKSAIWYHRYALKDELTRIFRDSSPTLSRSLPELDQLFAELNEAEVIKRLNAAPLFAHVDLTNTSEFPDFNYEILTTYLQHTTKIKRHIFLSSTMGLDTPYVRDSDIAKQHSVVPRIVWYYRNTLKNDLTRIFRKGKPTAALSLAELARRFEKLNETEVMESLIASPLFADFTAAGLSAKAFPNFRFDALLAYLKELSEVKKHLFYSSTMGLDLRHVRDRELAEQYSLKTNTIQTYRSRLKDDLLRMFGHKEERKAPSFDVLEQRFQQLSQTQILDRLSDSQLFAEMGLEDASTFPDTSHEAFTAYHSETLKIKKHILYNDTVADGNPKITMQELSKLYSLTESSIWYHRDTLKEDLSRIFRKHNSPTLILSELEQNFSKLDPAVVMERLASSVLFKESGLTNPLLFPNFNYYALMSYLRYTRDVKRHILFTSGMGLGGKTTDRDLADSYLVTLHTIRYHREKLKKDLLKTFSREATSLSPDLSTSNPP